MTMIEQIAGRLVETVGATLPAGRRASDPFSFDSDPRDSETAWYVDPPVTVSTGMIGGVESVTASFVVWVSRPAADDAAGAAVSLAGDLSRLRHALAALDVDRDGRVVVGGRIATDVRPRGEGAVTVVGAVRVQFEYEATAEDP